MERLTYEVIDLGYCVDEEEIKKFEIAEGQHINHGNAINLLAAYENTELTPEEIQGMADLDSQERDFFRWEIKNKNVLIIELRQQIEHLEKCLSHYE